MKFNFDKIRETVHRPDQIRRSAKNPRSNIAYKEFSHINIREDIRVPFLSKYFAVVIIDDKKIQTIYPTKKVKGGEIIWRRG